MTLPFFLLLAIGMLSPTDGGHVTEGDERNVLIGAAGHPVDHDFRRGIRVAPHR